MTTVSLSKTSAANAKVDAVVVGVQSDGDKFALAPGAEAVARAFGRSFGSTLKDLGVSADTGAVSKLPSAGATSAPIVVVAGLGKRGSVSDEDLRRAAGSALRALAGKATVALALPADSAEQVRQVVEGALLGAYAFDRYLTKKHEPVRQIVVLTELARKREAKEAVFTAVTVAAAVNFARDLINVPANDLYPETFADEMQSRGKKSDVRVSVLDEKALEAQGYGGLMGVGKGSARPPRLVEMAYRPARAKAHLAFVGKGITFDSGGLSIKPANAMTTMKCDMSGAAAVAGAVFAIAELGLPVQVTAYACLAENMPSGTATRPGDVLTLYGGKTVEILNTDAEGRLVLADGITTASALKPDLVIDVATLTGACQVALGARVSGLFGNDEGLQLELAGVAERAGELVWPLPIVEEMRERVRATKIADLSQVNSEPWGGALFAAAFLREFVGEGIPWAHLDIAGPAFNEADPFGYTPKGATGTAVRTLVQLARERSL